MKPFTNKEYYQPNSIEKLLKKIPQKNVLIDINNLLADESLNKLSKEQILTLDKKYQIENSATKFRAEINGFFKEFITYNLGNPESENNDFQSAKKFQELVGISDIDFTKEYEPIAYNKFTGKVEEIFIASKKCQEEEENQIEQVRIQFGIDEEKAVQIATECRKNIILNYAKSIIEDERVSPDEIRNLEEMKKNFNVEINMGEESKKAIEKYKTLWLIENSDIPIVEADIMLQKSEQCYFNGFADLYENRKITKSVGYAGPTFRMKIVKGVYFRAGNVGISRQTEDRLTLIDSGKLFITNKRILFVGKTNKTIKYNQIIDLTPYTDGVEIVKDAGKSPTFLLKDADGVIVTAIIARNIFDSQQ